MEKYRKIMLLAILAIAIIGAVSAILFGAMYDPQAIAVYEASKTGGIEAAQAMIGDSSIDAAALISKAKTANFFLDAGTIIAAIALFASLLGIIFFSLFFLVKAFMFDPKKAAATLSGILLLGLIFLVAYIVSSPTDLDGILSEELKVSASTSKLIGAGIITTYLLVAGVFISLVYAEVAKMMKRN